MMKVGILEDGTKDFSTVCVRVLWKGGRLAVNVTFKASNGARICFGSRNNVERRYDGSYGTSGSKEFAAR